MTPAELAQWFLTHGWRQRPEAFQFWTAEGLPRGMRLVVTPRREGDAWTLTGAFEARGWYKPIPNKAVAHTADDLKVVVASFSPRSFAHLIDRFAEEQGIAP